MRLPRQFTLKALVGLLLLAAVVLGWWSSMRRAQQREVAAAMRLMEVPGANIQMSRFVPWWSDQEVKQSEDFVFYYLAQNRHNDWFAIFDRVSSVRVDFARIPKSLEVNGQLDLVAPFVNVREVRMTNVGKGSDQNLLLSFPRLRKLSLMASNLDADATRALLRAAPRLQDLTIYYASFSDANMVDVAQLCDLEVLELPRTKISDAGLAALAESPRLRDLTLYGTSVTKVGILQLARIPSLRTITFSRSSALTSDVPELQAALPKVRFIIPTPKQRVWHVL